VAKKTISTSRRRSKISALRKRAKISAAPLASRKTPRKAKVVVKRGALTVTEISKLDDLRRELERSAGESSPLRWNADPDDVQRSVAQLVLTLVEFIRRVLERQAIRRMEAHTITDEQTEEIGRALMKLEETVVEIGAKFGVLPEDLNLDLGPVGKLM
jgi:hypothetical protein